MRKDQDSAVEALVEQLIEGGSNGDKCMENLSFLKTYSAARVGPRRTTRATVSVVGPGGKIATVASTDMHKLNVGAVFFFSTVSAQRKRAARF